MTYDDGYYEYGCVKCNPTIEDMSNKIYQLELYIEELTESHTEEVDYLHSELDKLEKELKER